MCAIGLWSYPAEVASWATCRAAIVLKITDCAHTSNTVFTSRPSRPPKRVKYQSIMLSMGAGLI